MIVEFFAILNIAILNAIVIYFVAGPKIENFIEKQKKKKRFEKEKCL
jgi:hypothetical protein